MSFPPLSLSSLPKPSISSQLRRKVSRRFGETDPSRNFVSNIIRTAKHLEPLKGGKVPIEILVRGKDTDQNAKYWEKCLDIIKGAGVCRHYDRCCTLMLT